MIGSIIKKKGLSVLNLFYVSDKKLFTNNWNVLKALISKKINVYIFSEYSFDKNKSFFPKDLFFTKSNKKDYFLRGNVDINSEDLLSSDLVV